MEPITRLGALDAAFLYSGEIFLGVHQHTIKASIIADIADPAERLAAAHKSANEAKTEFASTHGAPIDSFFSVGPLVEGVGLNITAWSYVDQLNVSILTCRESVPDPWQLSEDLVGAFNELTETASGEPMLSIDDQ